MGGFFADGRKVSWVNFPHFPSDLQTNLHDVETDIMYLNVLGTDMVVLNSSESIADLLDKRSAIYSDKVVTVYRVCSARG
jgi:hypothetical protein